MGVEKVTVIGLGMVVAPFLKGISFNEIQRLSGGMDRGVIARAKKGLAIRSDAHSRLVKVVNLFSRNIKKERLR